METTIDIIELSNKYLYRYTDKSTKKQYISSDIFTKIAKRDLEITDKICMRDLDVVIYFAIVETPLEGVAPIYTMQCNIVYPEYSITNAINNETRWYRAEKLHRDGDLPAIIKSLPDGATEKRWYTNGSAAKRPDGQANVIQYDKDGNTTLQQWYTKAAYRTTLVLDTDNIAKPAEISTNNAHKTESWYQYGDRHSDSSHPHELRTTIDGTIIHKKWYNSANELHRNAVEPALEEYIDGRISKRAWYVDGLLHRSSDLPTVIEYDADGRETRNEWYDNGDLTRASKFTYVAFPNNASVRNVNVQKDKVVIEYDDMLGDSGKL